MYVTEPLSSRHDRGTFACGVEALDRYIARQATQDIKKHFASVYVASPQDNEHEIAGFYSITVTGISQSDVPLNIRRKLPHYRSIPAVLLGRLAVDVRHRGCGVGRFLLLDAFTVYLKTNLALAFFVTEAKDETARAFYQHFGFRALNDDPDHSYITRDEINGCYT